MHLFKKYPFRTSLLILSFIVLLSYGLSTQFALWQDDNALAFKLQHLEEQVGVFGPGPLGLGAYRYVAVPYIPFYKLFGLNTFLFYSWAILFYFLASVAIFFFAKTITKNNLLALFSGAIFASGFVGSDGILRLFNSIQTSYSVIFVIFLFFFLYRFWQKRKPKYYLAAIFFFFAALETAYVRTQYLIFPVALFVALFLVRRYNLKSVTTGMLQLLPFAGLYYWQFFARNADPRSGLVTEFVKNVFSGQLEYTLGFFGSLGNFVLPQPVSIFLFDLARKISLDYTNQSLFLETGFLALVLVFLYLLFRKQKKILILFSLLQVGWLVFQWIFFHGSYKFSFIPADAQARNIFSSFIGGSFLILAASLLVRLHRERKTVVTLAFLLSWVVFNILAYSVYLPFNPLETVNRYLVHSLAAYAIFLPLLLFYLFKSRAVVAVITALVVFSNLALSLDYQRDFVRQRSIPTRNFYSSLKSFLPEIPKGSVLYFDVAQNSIAEQQFRDFFSVGSMPDETAIAVRYGIDRYDFKMTQNFEELQAFLQDTSLASAYSFFYDTTGLVDTTKVMRDNLSQGGEIVLEPALGEQKIDAPSVTPILVELTASARLKDELPAYSCDLSLSFEEKNTSFDYLLSRQDFYKNASIQTGSQEKYHYVNYLLDDNPETIWRGNRGWWLENDREVVSVDLGKTIKVDQLIWVNGFANTTPTVYSVEVSLDGQHWQEVKKVEAPVMKKNGAVVFEDFEPANARYVRMIIEETFDKDSPAISEIEVVEAAFVGIDRQKAFKLGQNPFDCVKTNNDFDLARNFLRKRGVPLSLSWKTDKKDEWLISTSAFLLKPDAALHRYQFLLPAGGTKLEGIRIEPPNAPVDVSISKMKVVYYRYDF